MKHVVKWTNTYSGETGYVESTSTKNRCFYNTPEIDHAKAYANEKSAAQAVKTLQSYGQGEEMCNEFELIPV